MWCIQSTADDCGVHVMVDLLLTSVPPGWRVWREYCCFIVVCCLPLFLLEIASPSLCCFALTKFTENVEIRAITFASRRYVGIFIITRTTIRLTSSYVGSCSFSLGQTCVGHPPRRGGHVNWPIRNNIFRDNIADVRVDMNTARVNDARCLHRLIRGNYGGVSCVYASCKCVVFSYRRIDWAAEQSWHYNCAGDSFWERFLRTETQYAPKIKLHAAQMNGTTPRDS